MVLLPVVVGLFFLVIGLFYPRCPLWYFCLSLLLCLSLRQLSTAHICAHHAVGTTSCVYVCMPKDLSVLCKEFAPCRAFAHTLTHTHIRSARKSRRHRPRSLKCSLRAASLPSAWPRLSVQATSIGAFTATELASKRRKGCTRCCMLHFAASSGSCAVLGAPGCVRHL